MPAANALRLSLIHICPINEDANFVLYKWDDEEGKHAFWHTSAHLLEMCIRDSDYGPHVLLAMVFIITNLFTELITNNAAAALAFPLALSISAQLGVSPVSYTHLDVYKRQFI